MLEIKKLTSYWDKTVPLVSDFSIKVKSGEITALMGPSGCGKSTLLYAISGFRRPNSGRIVLCGVDITETPPHKRRISILFQDSLLFESKTVKQNIEFGIKYGINKMPISAREERVDELLKLIRMEDFSNSTADKLSGGQKSRVSLARAIAPSPKFLLLDEPLIGLEEELKQEIGMELRALIKSSNMGAIMVTHNTLEAKTIADNIYDFSDLNKVSSQVR
jgi:putrescine transport system ATP-binding protein